MTFFFDCHDDFKAFFSTYSETKKDDNLPELAGKHFPEDQSKIPCFTVLYSTQLNSFT